jgi:hypothetical protein
MLFDHDQDLAPAPRPTIAVEELTDHHRLVVNPMLAILDVVGSMALIGHAIQTRNAALFLAAVGLLLLVFLLFQFHCLDCGATGWYIHANRHACEAVLGRCTQGAARSARLSARTQRLIWVYIVVAGVLAATLMAVARL